MNETTAIFMSLLAIFRSRQHSLPFGASEVVKINSLALLVLSRRFGLSPIDEAIEHNVTVGYKDGSFSTFNFVNRIKSTLGN